MGTHEGHDHSWIEAQRVNRGEAKELLMRGDVLFVDVRSPEEYRFSHIPGAINLPLAELMQRTPTLPKERRIITYCT